MRILFALPGLHKYDRGAETAFISIATELANFGESVTLIGSGQDRPGTPYRFIRAASVGRENFEALPSVPFLRNATGYEELTFAFNLLRRYRPTEYDITLSCGYPFTNWILRRPTLQGFRPSHIFVTQNGDWPAAANSSEFRFFGCEGLVCTNPDFYDRNKNRWPSRLVPNGVDCKRFSLGVSQRANFGLPTEPPIALMVSALDDNKRVDMGIKAVSHIPHMHLVVAGDGPLRREIDARAAALLPGRYTRLKVSQDRMPALYRSADVFLHLSKEESFGNVYIEAMACGLPIVAHDSPRLRWIVGDDEFLLDTVDDLAIAKKIETARDSAPHRREERAIRAANFSWPKISAMYRSFMEEIIEASGSNKDGRA
jgi:glycosyltransferase involved in cell wall biosynthesis